MPLLFGDWDTIFVDREYTFVSNIDALTSKVSWRNDLRIKNLLRSFIIMYIYYASDQN